jgi:hypothetical protein
MVSMGEGENKRKGDEESRPKAQYRWLMPAILATWEPGIRRIMV